MDPQADFWTWAVRAYAGPGVAKQCLILQDAHDQCVPLLLWAAWTADQDVPLNDSLARQAADLARHWSEDVIAPLRAVRRRLKSPVSSGDEPTRLPLREKIKSAELEAERALMRLLEDLVLPGYAKNSILIQSVAERTDDALAIVANAWSEKVPSGALASLTERLTKG